MVVSASADAKSPALSRMAAAVMLSGSAMMALIFTVLSPVLPQIAAHFADSGGTTVAQFIASAPGVGVIVGGLSGGFLVDRIGRRQMLAVALFAFAAAGCAPLYVDDHWSLLASRALLGWSGATVQAAVIGMIAATFREPLRAKMIGYETAIGSATAVVSILGSGAIAQTHGWRAPAALYLLSLPLLAMALLSLPRDRQASSGAPRARGSAAFGAFLKPLLLFFVVIPFVYATNFMLSIQLPFLLAENGVEGPAAKARLMVTAVATGVAGAASSGWVRQLFGERASLTLTVLLMGGGHLTLGFAHSAPMVVLGGAVAGLGGGMLLPNLMAVATSRAADDLRSRAAGLVYTMAYVGEFLNPLALRPLSEAVGIHRTFQTVGLALLALLFVAGLFVGPIRRPTNQTRQGKAS